MTAPAVRDYLRALSADPAGPADADLLARFARTRDEAAFELLVWRHAALVQRVCRSVLRDRHAAEDAAQAAFLVLARKAGTFAGRGTVVGWVYRVARRAAVRLAKQRARLPGPLSHPDRLAAVEVPDAPAAAEDAARLWAEIDRLPDRYRVPVLLCHFEGLTHPEAARRLGWPVGTVAGRLSRARALLGRRLGKLGVGLPAVGGAVCLTPAAVVTAMTRTAVTFAAGRTDPAVPPAVVTLAEGVTRAMSVSPIKAVAAAVLACGLAAGVWGVGPGAIDDKASPTKAAGVAKVEVLKPADAVTRAKLRRQLRAVGQAMTSYHDAFGVFPQDITDESGKPLLSWRVALLPYLNHPAQYRGFALSEPWDSPHNQKIAHVMPAVYRLPGQAEDARTTYFQGLAGPGTAFEPGKPVRSATYTDGMSRTLWAVVGGPPVPWTKPGALTFDPKRLELPAMPYTNVFPVVTADGTPRLLPPKLSPDLLRRLAVRNDAEVIRDEELADVPPGPLTAADRTFAADLLRRNDGLSTRAGELLDERKALLLDQAKRNVVAPATETDLEALFAEEQRLAELIDTLRGSVERLRTERDRGKK